MNETYNNAMVEYHRAKAKGDWEAAVKALERAIDSCYCLEALPELERLHMEASRQAKPMNWLERFWVGA
jgi:hypothetical protein